MSRHVTLSPEELYDLLVLVNFAEREVSGQQHLSPKESYSPAIARAVKALTREGLIRNTKLAPQAGA